MTVHAYQTPVAGLDDAYAIDVPELGLRLERERFPSNRMAKALHELGHAGLMNVYGPSPTTGQPRLRYTLDVAANGERMTTEEARDGFQRRPWRPADVASLMKRLVHYGIGPQDARDDEMRSTTPANDPRPSDTGNAA